MTTLLLVCSRIGKRSSVFVELLPQSPMLRTSKRPCDAIFACAYDLHELRSSDLPPTSGNELRKYNLASELRKTLVLLNRTEIQSRVTLSPILHCQVTWLRDLASQAETKITNLMVERLDINAATNVDDAMKAVSHKLSAMSKEFKDTPLLLGVCDFNVSGSLFEDPLEMLASFVGRLTSASPRSASVLVTMPDQAKDGSKRGLKDEEDKIEKELWSKKLWTDKRWQANGRVKRAAVG